MLSSPSARSLAAVLLEMDVTRKWLDGEHAEYPCSAQPQNVPKAAQPQSIPAVPSRRMFPKAPNRKLSLQCPTASYPCSAQPQKYPCSAQPQRIPAVPNGRVSHHTSSRPQPSRKHCISCARLTFLRQLQLHLEASSIQIFKHQRNTANLSLWPIAQTLSTPNS